MRSARLLALLVPLAVALAGPGAVAATGHLVRITSTLSPDHLTIATGDSVTFRNEDDERHRMRSRADVGEYDTGDLEPGESYRVTFSTPGTYTYIDERDDENQAYWGTIVVADEPTPDPTDDGAGGGGTGGGTTGGGAGGSTAPSTATIRLADRAFSPGSVTIAAGGTVTWRNDDDRDHTATSTGGAFNSGSLAPGSTFRKTFAQAGSFPFLCAIHPEMRGTVTVTGGTGSGGTGGTAATPRPVATPKPTATPATDPGDPGAAAGAPARGNVSMIDLDFQPGEVEVGTGGTVTWTNTGVAPHTATASGGAFDSGQLNPGASFSQTFAAPGRFAYACAIHPSMTGVVVVRATAGAAITGSAGPEASAAASPPASAPPASAAPTTGSGASAPPGAGPGEVAGAGDSGPAPGGQSEAAEVDAAGFISTVLALALIVGALMVGAGLVLGVTTRGNTVRPTT